MFSQLLSSGKLQFRNWLTSTPAERRRKLRGRLQQYAPWVVATFGMGLARFSNMLWAYQPDSFAEFRAHPEFRTLFRRFIRHNRLTNAGDSVRLWSFILNIKQVLQERVDGDFAELGVWRGNTSAVLAHFAAVAGRQMHLFDTFQGFDRKDLQGVDSDIRQQFANTSIAVVQEVIGPAWSACRVTPGYFPGSLTTEHYARSYAVVSLDCDLYEPMKEGLQFFYAHMPRGGLLLLHDYSSMHWSGAKRAVDEFCAVTGELPVLIADKCGSAFIRRAH